METNPYTKVWSTSEDFEKDLLKDVNNGVLFEPSYDELGKRSASTCRHLLRKARSLGNTIEGHETFNEALFHRDMAEKMFAKRDEILAKAH